MQSSDDVQELTAAKAKAMVANLSEPALQSTALRSDEPESTAQV